MDDSAYGGIESSRRASTGENCLRDVMMAELGPLNVKTLVAIAKSKNLNVETILEKSELIDIIIEHDVNDREMRNVRNHKKRVHPTKYSVPLSAWDECNRHSLTNYHTTSMGWQFTP